MLNKYLIAVLLIASGLAAQTHTSVTKEDSQTITGAKTFTGSNTFTNTNGFSGVSTFTGNAVLNHKSLGFVNAITNCGLVGDGVTNDGAALQACINANQGLHIVLPKTRAVGTCDYNINGTTILPKGHGQIIEGEGAGWGGAGSNTTFCKTVEDGLPGIDVIHANCQGCTIRNLHVTGPSPWSSVTLGQNIPPCSPPEGIVYAAGVTCVTGGDGIKVEAGFTTLENVYVENWGRHGIYTTSEFGGFPDNFHYVNVTSNNNRGDGYYCKGGDCNAGSTLQFHGYNNQMYGMDEHSFLGNSHYSPQMTGNHPAGAGVGSTFASTATRTSNVVTLTATGHNFSAGNVIVVAGMSDATFNGTFSLSAVTSTTATYPQTAANSSATGGTARLTSNNEYFAFTGLTGGAYNNVGASAWNTYYSPYCEGSQNPFVAGGKTVIIGGDQGCGIDYTNNPLVIGNGVNGSNFAGPNFLTGSSGVAQGTPTDNGLLLSWFAGKTVDQSIQHRFVGGQSTHNYFEWVFNVGGTPGGTTSSLTLWREGNGQKQRMAFLAPGVGGYTLINDEGGAARFNNATGSSGNVEFYSAGGGQLIGDFFSNGQYAMTPSANNIDVISIKRFTDTSPTGNFLNFKNAANASVYSVDIKGNTVLTNLLISTAVPTISSGFGTSPSIATNNGTAAFTVNVGTGGTANSGVIGLPTAANGWNCFVTDITTQSTTVFLQKQTASSTTSCTVGNFNTAGAAAAFVASDILSVSAFAR